MSAVLRAALCLLCLAPAVQAADGPGRCPPYPDGRKVDATPLFEALDRNHDGRITRAEWRAARAPEPSWRMFMSQPAIRAQGFITRAQFLAVSPPPGIDTDCDGRVTLDEFLATKRWKMAPPPGGAAPGPH